MVYPPEKYVEHNEDFTSSCREFHRTELPDLVKQLNDPNNLCPSCVSTSQTPAQGTLRLPSSRQATACL